MSALSPKRSAIGQSNAENVGSFPGLSAYGQHPDLFLSGAFWVGPLNGPWQGSEPGKEHPSAAKAALIREALRRD
jgi:hypothetical protein